MQNRGKDVLFSASDIVAFLECEHATALALRDLEAPLERAEDDETLQLVQDKGFAHEQDYLRALRAKHRVAEIPGEGEPAELARETVRAMREGHEVVFQAAFLAEPFFGRADFLRRVEGPSGLGRWHYEALDTKLARHPRAKFVLQLAYYSDLLAREQGVAPALMHLALGDGTERQYRVADFSRYFGQVRERFLGFVAKEPKATYPERVAYCPFCPWRHLCEAQWEADDYLNRVAGIARSQVERLKAAGVRTLEGVARLGKAARVARLQGETVAKLQAQAALQLEARRTGKPEYERLDLDDGRRRGFYRLPEPDEADVFFDMEGDPFEEDGLEYLFGVRYRENGEWTFRAFWAHERAEERRAFEALMDFLSERLGRHPGMHVYHYAHYELTALKRLMSLHGTREAEVDDFLRRGTLVDLYKVVREALRVSEGYSLKDVEAFYMAAREGEVRDAGASIVHYERWRQSRDGAELEKIRRYNEDDCRSTQLLRDWLLGLRPAGLPWFAGPHPVEDGRPVSEKAARIEAELAGYRERLLAGLPEDPDAWGPEAHVRELVFQLLDFHRRSAKPDWWALFARQDLTEDELVEDAECLGGLRLATDHEPVPEARSLIYTFSYPEQETKLRAGKDGYRTDTAQRLGSIVELDEEARRVRIKVRRDREVPRALSIGPGGPINTDALRLALLRFADAFAAGDGRFGCVRSVLHREAPRLRGRRAGQPVLPGKADLISEATDAVERLDESCLFVQGPPGAGKTFTGSHLIVALLKAGKRIGVTSHSHKAINHLLEKVEECARERGVEFSGAKKSSGDEDAYEGEFIEDVRTNDEAIEGDYQLLAGTAWLFADPGLEEALDYLFVDEAGQVSLANLVAAGTAARNLVLLGDQMQLGQPIKGVHPGRSGDSTLDYLLDGVATIAPDRGIFLPTTWRMHEDVCRFISEAVYDDRLRPRPENQRQALLLGEDAHRALRPTGIVFLPTPHEGNGQRSREEADEIRALYESLLGQRFRDKEGEEHPMTTANLLVVAPYNAQVNLLKSVLPEGARVGTIDKFQGQEAEAVLVSMTTSSGDYLPRNLEFLYDKNRLNVALSRAKCLAVVLASPALLHVKCATPEQMALVNTLCWVKEYSGGTKVARA